MKTMSKIIPSKKTLQNIPSERTTEALFSLREKTNHGIGRLKFFCEFVNAVGTRDKEMTRNNGLCNDCSTV